MRLEQPVLVLLRHRKVRERLLELIAARVEGLDLLLQHGLRDRLRLLTPAQVLREVEEVGFLGGDQCREVVHQGDLLVARTDVREHEHAFDREPPSVPQMMPRVHEVPESQRDLQHPFELGVVDDFLGHAGNFRHLILELLLPGVELLLEDEPLHPRLDLWDLGHGSDESLRDSQLLFVAFECPDHLELIRGGKQRKKHLKLFEGEDGGVEADDRVADGVVGDFEPRERDRYVGRPLHVEEGDRAVLLLGCRGLGSWLHLLGRVFKEEVH
mmetsp:Transcript_33593/g.79527  ORF Transcript_33593/g.79527 Transcript_33593/m.79527 type:complete len:270 (-) Transcript_33593:206-1015(-)